MELEGSLPCLQKYAIGPISRLYVTFHNRLFIKVKSCKPLAQPPKLEDHPFFGCPRLLIKYIRNYPPYQEVVITNRNQRTRHAVVTVTHIMWSPFSRTFKCLFHFSRLCRVFFCPCR
jgi:hypothetical protein